MQKPEDLALFKERMRAGDLMLGMQHNSGSPLIAELLGYCGFDFLIVDQEHSGYSLTVTERIVAAAQGSGVVAFIRVLQNDAHLIMQAMETGAHGVLVPHVMSRGDCEAALAAMRYRPDGIRGKSSASRAAKWGTVDWHQYQTWANAEPLLIPILEDAEAIDVVEDIASVPGLELVAVGPGDLSQSYGLPGLGLRAEPVMAALQRTVNYCVPRNIAVMTIPLPDLTNEWTREVVALGANVVWYGADMVNIGRHFQHLAQVKVSK